MNSKSLVVIVAMGAFGALAFAMVAMFGVNRLATERPMVRACIEVAERHKVSEVTLTLEPPTGSPRTLRVGYATTVLAPSMEAQTAEMETIAQFALEKVKVAEFAMDDLLRQEAAEKRKPVQLPVRGAVAKVTVRRQWRRDSGCFKRSEDATHEWIPPPPPPRK